MDQMVAVLLGALAPGRSRRWQPRTHPYTLDGRAARTSGPIRARMGHTSVTRQRMPLTGRTRTCRRRGFSACRQLRATSGALRTRRDEARPWTAKHARRSGSGSVVLAFGSDADRTAWSAARRQPRA